jgi:hypothetical protein
MYLHRISEAEISLIVPAVYKAFFKIKYRDQFPHPETCGVGKWGRTKEKEGAGYEATACFMAQDISEK